MLPFLMMRMVGSPFTMIAGGVCAALAIFGCIWCAKCRIRHCGCCKRFLRCCCDRFDDFEVMMLIHEVFYDQKLEKVTTSVRVTAGDHKVKTDTSSQGIFQQPLTVFVEQGTGEILIDLLDSREKVLSQIKLDPEKDLLSKQNGKEDTLVEKVYIMKQKGKGVTNPKVKMTVVFDAEDEVESGLLSGLGLSSSTEFQMKQQLKKSGGASKGMSETQVLAQACNGPLDMFSGMGNAETIYASVVGPPHQKKYSFNVWPTKQAMDKKQAPAEEVDLLKVKSIQGDPARGNVFTVNYFDSNRVVHTMSFRRIDRAREVWIEMLQLLIKKVHAENKEKKDKKANTKK